MTAPDPEHHLPLTSVSFEILLALARGARHGYAIMRDVEKRTGGAITLHPGSLYRALARLAEEGLVDEVEDHPGQEADGRRRYYALTRLGKRVAASEARRLERQVAAARNRRILDTA